MVTVSAGSGPLLDAAPEPRPGRSSQDEQACRMLLAFTRLVRGPRQSGGLPAHIEALLASGFLAPRHLGAFALIALDGPLAVSELAVREGLALSTASLLVTQLAEAGLVERREDPLDRRRTLVSVAPEHRRESEAVLQSKLAPLRRALDRMGESRAEALLEGLGILAEEVSGNPEPRGASADRRDVAVASGDGGS